MIREYEDSDFADIERIYNLSKADEFTKEKFDVIVTPLSDDEGMLELLNSSKVYIYEAGRIAGFIGVKKNYISWLFVDPSYRGQGIGKELMSHVLSTLSGDVSLNVARSNSVAKGLYENLGFKVVKEFTSKYQDYPVIVCNMVAPEKE